MWHTWKRKCGWKDISRFGLTHVGQRILNRVILWGVSGEQTIGKRGKQRFRVPLSASMLGAFEMYQSVNCVIQNTISIWPEDLEFQMPAQLGCFLRTCSSLWGDPGVKWKWRPQRGHNRPALCFRLMTNLVPLRLKADYFATPWNMTTQAVQFHYLPCK